MEEILLDITEETIFFFKNLNWAFILTLSFVLYGVKYKEEFSFFKDLTKNISQYRIWIVSLITLLFFAIFKALEKEFTVFYLSELLRSVMVAIIFNSEILNKVKLSKKRGSNG